jgi:hypothetical protein
VNAGRPRTRYERNRSRSRRQLRALLSPGIERAAEDRTTTPGNEAATRAALGMPAGHPESLTTELSPADEVKLAAYATDMWPHDEYADITADDYGERWDWGEPS